MNDKLPPQNIEAEEAILASILLEPNLMNRVAEIITPDSFYVPSHQHIYQAILDIYYQEKPTDLMTVTTWLADHKLLKKIGGKNKLSQLVKGDILPNNICNGLQKLSPRLAKTPVFGSDYFAKTPCFGSDYLQMDSQYLQTAHKNSSRLRLSAKTIFITECQF